MSYDLVTGDTGSKLVVTIKDSATLGPADLTGCTVRFRWEGSAGMVTKIATVTAPLTGVASYQFGAGDIVAPKMKIEVEVTDAATNVVTGTDLIELAVREQLG